MVQFGSANEFFETAAEGGNAFRLQDIDGIGPATEDKIMAVREINSTDDVKQMSADELADKANISRSRASKAIQGLGGNPSVSKRNKSTGSVSAAGMRTRQGDFWVEFTDMDKARARNDAQSRSEEAVRMDEKKRAPITTDLEQWKSAPGRWDYPGVDTPTQSPGVRPKDYKAGGQFDTAEFNEDGSADYDKSDSQDTFPRKKRDGMLLETGEDRLLAGDVASQIPEGGIPGVAPQDFETEPETPGNDPTMGAKPSSRRLPEPVFQGLADGVQADMAFMDAEEERTQQQAENMAFDFPAWTLSRGQTYLNEKVYGEDRDDLEALQEKVSSVQPSSDESLELSKGEYNTFQQIVREGAEEEIDRAERMEANIFGDTDEQAEVAQEALQGIISNPPQY